MGDPELYSVILHVGFEPKLHIGFDSLLCAHRPSRSAQGRVMSSKSIGNARAEQEFSVCFGKTSAKWENKMVLGMTRRKWHHFGRGTAPTQGKIVHPTIPPRSRSPRCYRLREVAVPRRVDSPCCRIAER